MRLSSSTGRRIVAGVGAGATVLAVVSITQPASAATARHVVSGSRPTWTAQAKVTGHTAKSTALDFGVLLKMRNQSQAVATLQSVSDPKSANYGKWLTNAQFDANYAPSAADVSSVRAWLKSQGFSVTKTLKSGMYVEVSGTTAQVEKTFGTSMNTYSYKGHTVQANTTDLSLPSNAPAAVTDSVEGFVGLDQGAVLKTPASSTVLPGPPPGGRFGVQPCSAYFGQKLATDKPTAYGAVSPYATCGYYPLQLQSAYGEAGLVKSGVNGHGVTVAITDGYAAPTMLSDAQRYSKLHGLQQFSAGQYREILPKKFQFTDPSGPQGWYGEETLDVDAVHGMAPGANVVYVAGSDDAMGLTNAWAETIDNHVADIITNSWTVGTSAGVDDVKDIGAAQKALFEQFSLEAALTGITVNFSSGDDGDQTAGGATPKTRTVDFPADLPYVTGVGGTSVEIGGSGQWMGEYGWSNSYSSLNAKGTKWTPAPPGDYSSGGGGGTSYLYTQPFYQQGNVPARLSKMNGKTPMRVVPDISMPGDPNTGLRVGETQQFSNGTYYAEYRIGGTSLSSPLLAGVLAVADQKAGHPLGFVNPLYYSLLGSSALHDLVAPKTPVTQVRTEFTNGVNKSGGIDFLLQTIDSNSNTLADTPGYDNETGVGSPNGPAFFTQLAKH